jgi:putative ABC transport system substrate-binding protein
MRRREFIILLGGAAAAWPLSVRAQQAGAMRRVGVLMNGAATEAEPQSYLAAFMQGIRSLGWVEGQNVRIDVRWNASDAMLSKIYAAQLIGLMPDAILTHSTINLEVVRQATSTVPVVFVSIADPVTQGFIASMRQPGGNLTGFSLLEFSLGGKWIDLLKEVTPGLARVGVMFNPETGPIYKFFMPVIEAAAASLGIEPIAVPVRTIDDIEPALARFARAPNGGLVLPAGIPRLQSALIPDLARRFRLPSIAGAASFAKDGGLMAYGPGFDLARHFQQAATYVDRILKGVKPGALPVQAPDRYRFVINLKTAKALGLTVPLPLFGFADEVIE